MSGSSSTTRMWALAILGASVRVGLDAPISSLKEPGRCGGAEAVGKDHLLWVRRDCIGGLSRFGHVCGLGTLRWGTGDRGQGKDEGHGRCESRRVLRRLS